MDSPFFYKLTLHQGASTGDVTAAWVQKLPLIQQVVNQVVVIPTTEGKVDPGMYVWDGMRWRFILPYVEVSQAIIDGSTLDVFYNMDVEYDNLSPTVTLWRNGLQTTEKVVPAILGSVWIGVTKKQSGDVSSVNGVQPDAFGDVEIDTHDGNVQTVSGQAPDANGNVVIKIADNTPGTGNSLIVGDGSGTGVMKLKTLVAGANITISTVGGNLQISSSGGGGGSGTLTAVQSEGTGTSLVDNDGTSGGVAILKSIAQGTGITITPSGDGKTLTFTAVSSYVLPVATTSILGGVKQGVGVTIAADGTLTSLGSVGSVGAGQTLINDDGSTSHAAKLKSIVAGTNITLSSDANTVTVNSTAGTYTLPAATASVLGGVKIGANVNVTADGTISVAAPTTPYTLPIASASVLGGVKVGTGLTIDGSGVLSSTGGGGGAVASVNGKTGAVNITAGANIFVDNTGSDIVISLTGAIAEAPNDGTLYGRKNLTWTAIPDVGNAITSVTGQAGTGAILLVEASPPANSAVMKSLVQGNNVSITEAGGLITIAAAIPAGTVATVNSKGPDGSGNVTLTASDVSALPLLGGTMQGLINMANFKVTGLPTPSAASDAVPLTYIQSLSIDGGTFA